MSEFRVLIPKYVEILEKESENSELYKWEAIQHFQKNWKKDCPDEKFFGMFKEAFKKKENLIFQNSYGFLSKLAENMPKEAKEHLAYLFQDEIPLEERIPVYQERSNKLLQELKTKLGKDNINHQQDERTISFLLTLHNPEKYFLYKENLYRKLCEHLGVPQRQAGQKYFHFSSLASEILPAEISSNEELLKNSILKEIRSKYSFNSDNLIFQDIVYRTLIVTEQNELDREFLSQVAADIENSLLNKAHPLTKHIWFDNDTTKYRQVSVFEQIDTHPLHYELMMHTDIAWEFHPEGNRNEKEFMEPFIQSYNRSKYKLTHWKYAVSGPYTPGEFHKISPKKRFKVERKGEKYLEMIELLTLQFIELYNDTDLALKNYLKINKDNPNSLNYTFKNMAQESVNQILYGPPGTGKTYHTIDKALKIVDAQFYEENKATREKLVSHFNSLLYDEKNNPEGQIIFTTFHQSLAYEDFIEGIKPTMAEGGELEYEIKDGIFKQMVSLAKRKTSSNFLEAYTRFLKDINESSSDYLTLKTKRGKEYRVNVNSNNNLSLFTSEDIKKQGVLSKDKLLRFFNGDLDVYVGWEGYANGVIEHLKDKYQLSSESEKRESKNYVLIIDEINRGNVSSIFGELITLIEDDKRMGKANELAVTLPYSRESFSIPENLYIIGTMNTADRSVESLDTALRRRFSFTEMLPQSELLKNRDIDGIDLTKLLDTINKRMEYLVGRDHTIGHAFLINVHDLPSLQHTFSKNIIPLLQEYFYGDYSKMEMVLGPLFFEEQDKNLKKEEIFAVSNSNFEFPEHDLKLKNISEMRNDLFLLALKRLMNFKETTHQ